MTLPAHIAAGVQGHVVGRVTTGTDLLRSQSETLQLAVLVGHRAGAVLHAPPEPVDLVLRARPSVRPLPSTPTLTGREAELRQALDAVARSESPVVVHGPDGAGRSLLLRTLATGVPASTVPDGVVELDVDADPLLDVLQRCFERFFETDEPVQLTPRQTRVVLQGLRALVVLDCDDGPSLSGRDLTSLRLALRRGVVVVAAAGPEEAGTSIPLGPLPDDAVRALVERELGRSLGDEDRSVLALVWSGLDGNLHDLRWLTAQVRAGATTFAALLDLAPSEWAMTLRARVLADLGRREREAVAALAALPVPVPAAQLSALLDPGDVRALLAPLRTRGIVALGPKGYRLVESLHAAAAQAFQLRSLRQRALVRVLEHSERSRDEPRRLVAGLDAALWLLDWAVEERRFAEAVRLGAAIDPAVVLARRWGRWGRMLQAVRLAATELGDRRARAWALHQLGTRALGLEQYRTARSHLSDALAMRLALGDVAGAELTRHNLAFLPAAEPAVERTAEFAPVPPVQPVAVPPAARRGQGWLRLVLVAVLAVALTLAAGRSPPREAATTGAPEPLATPTVAVSPSRAALPPSPVLALPSPLPVPVPAPALSEPLPAPAVPEPVPQPPPRPRPRPRPQSPSPSPTPSTGPAPTSSPSPSAPPASPAPNPSPSSAPNPSPSPTRSA